MVLTNIGIKIINTSMNKEGTKTDRPHFVNPRVKEMSKCFEYVLKIKLWKG